MKIYIHNYLEPLEIKSDLYEEKHANDIGNAFDLDKHHYLSDINLDYWIWKNNDHEIVGKMQLRKWFLNSKREKYEQSELEKLFSIADIMVLSTPLIFPSDPKKEKVSNSRWYNFYHASFDINSIAMIINELHGSSPAQTWHYWLNSTSSMIYANLYIAKNKVIKEYYDWMFPILEQFIAKSAFRHYPNEYQQRAPGYIAERLFSFWVFTTPNLRVITPSSINEHGRDKTIRFAYP